MRMGLRRPTLLTVRRISIIFFFNDTATTEIYTLSLHDALPISIVLPPESQQVDFEGEIGVVIGRPLRRATEGEARAAIAGITCVNDVTARDLQRTEEQWTRAKGFDTFCPVGPRVVPVDPRRFNELEVFCRVNGKQRQHGRAPDMVFSMLALVSVVSHVMTLEPGDLIATGTPAGVGPLAPGDVVEVEIPGVGVLRNPVVAEAR